MRLLKAICDQLDLRIDEVLLDEPGKAATGTEEVALTEFRSLSPAQQEAVIAMMRAMKT